MKFQFGGSNYWSYLAAFVFVFYTYIYIFTSIYRRQITCKIIAVILHAPANRGRAHGR